MSASNREAELIQRMTRGEVAALDELYDRYTPILLGVALRIVRNVSEAEDAVQDAWLYAWRKIESFDAGRSSFSGWLIMIARSRALDRYRSRSKRRVAEDSVEMESVDMRDPALEVEHSDLSRRMRQALAELKPEQRRAIEIAFFDGLSHAQVARRMDKPLGTVKYWIREGLTKLSQRLPKEGVL